MRMNTNRLVNDDEDEEYIRRPMSSLTTSSTPAASSNITMISASDGPTAQSNEKQNKNKNQTIPNARDFPALTSTTPAQNNGKKVFLSFFFCHSLVRIVASSGVWTTSGTNPSAKPPTTQQKKKNAGMSKKKFMEEIQAMPPPPSFSSTDDFPTIGLSELGQRLITEENEPIVETPKKEKKPPSPIPPPPPSAVKQEKKPDENKSTVQSNKKVCVVLTHLFHT